LFEAFVVTPQSVEVFEQLIADKLETASNDIPLRTSHRLNFRVTIYPTSSTWARAAKPRPVRLIQVDEIY
jgi:hypothetical protein